MVDVPELTHDPAEDGFHEIQLSGKQLVFLFMATTVLSVIIFLCGVLVGRGVRTERGEPAVDSPIAATEQSVPPAPEAPPPATSEAPRPDQLRYHEELQKDATRPKLDKPAVEPPAPATKPETQPAAPRETPAATAAAADVPTSGRQGTWVIQVQALQNRAAAGSIVKGLIAKGYPAFLLPPAAGAPPIYRVQIGRYRERAEAEKVARRLEKEEQFSPDIKR